MDIILRKRINSARESFTAYSAAFDREVPRENNSDYDESRHDIKASPGVIRVASISDRDDLLENEGVEDEALMDDEIINQSIGYGYDRGEGNYQEKDTFDMLDRSNDQEIIGNRVS